MDGLIAGLQEALRDAGQTKAAAVTGMPAEFYTSPEFFRMEQERIFRKEWVCLGHIGDVPKPGDYFATQLLDEPLIVVRGADGKVRVLSNVCRHRGTTLVTGCGQARRLICPYHGWAYSTEGALVNAPYMEGVPNFDMAARPLPEFASEIWKGFIYVNLDGKASPLAPRLVGLDKIIERYHLEDMSLFKSGMMTWQTNWKCQIENFIDGYHLAFVHPQTIHPMFPSHMCERIEGGPGYTVIRERQVPNLPERGVYPPDAGDYERRASMVFCIYPSHLIVVSSTANSLAVRPLSADSVEIHWRKVAWDKAMPAELQASSVDYFNKFMEEDRVIVEGLQRGLKSNHVDRCALGPENMVGTVADFYGYIARLMG